MTCVARRGRDSESCSGLPHAQAANRREYRLPHYSLRPAQPSSLCLRSCQSCPHPLGYSGPLTLGNGAEDVHLQLPRRGTVGFAERSGEGGPASNAQKALCEYPASTCASTPGRVPLAADAEHSHNAADRRLGDPGPASQPAVGAGYLLNARRSISTSDGDTR